MKYKEMLYSFTDEDMQKLEWHVDQLLPARELTVGMCIALHPKADVEMLRTLVKTKNFGLDKMALIVERVPDFNNWGECVLIKRMRDDLPVDVYYKAKCDPAYVEVPKQKIIKRQSDIDTIAKQDMDIKRVIKDFVNSDLEQVSNYDDRITQETKSANEIPYGYIQKRVAPKSCFKGMGSGTVRDAITRAVVYGHLTLLHDHKRKGMYKIGMEFLK